MNSAPSNPRAIGAGTARSRRNEAGTSKWKWTTTSSALLSGFSRSRRMSIRAGVCWRSNLRSFRSGRSARSSRAFRRLARSEAATPTRLPAAPRLLGGRNRRGDRPRREDGPGTAGHAGPRIADRADCLVTLDLSQARMRSCLSLRIGPTTRPATLTIGTTLSRPRCAEHATRTARRYSRRRDHGMLARAVAGAARGSRHADRRGVRAVHPREPLERRQDPSRIPATRATLRLRRRARWCPAAWRSGRSSRS